MGGVADWLESVAFSALVVLALWALGKVADRMKARNQRERRES